MCQIFTGLLLLFKGTALKLFFDEIYFFSHSSVNAALTSAFMGVILLTSDLKAELADLILRRLETDGKGLPVLAVKIKIKQH